MDHRPHLSHCVRFQTTPHGVQLRQETCATYVCGAASVVIKLISHGSYEENRNPGRAWDDCSIVLY